MFIIPHQKIFKTFLTFLYVVLAKLFRDPKTKFFDVYGENSLWKFSSFEVLCTLFSKYEFMEKKVFDGKSMLEIFYSKYHYS